MTFQHCSIVSNSKWHMDPFFKSLVIRTKRECLNSFADVMHYGHYALMRLGRYYKLQ